MISREPPADPDSAVDVLVALAREVARAEADRADRLELQGAVSGEAAEVEAAA